jgi:hypothetical protein
MRRCYLPLGLGNTPALPARIPEAQENVQSADAGDFSAERTYHDHALAFAVARASFRQFCNASAARALFATRQMSLCRATRARRTVLLHADGARSSQMLAERNDDFDGRSSRCHRWHMLTDAIKSLYFYLPSILGTKKGMRIARRMPIDPAIISPTFLGLFSFGSSMPA